MYIDPHTGHPVALFNPRQMNWTDHFTFRGKEVVGKNPSGRATAALLFRATPRYSPPDLQWEILENVASNEQLYLFLNHLRYRRLQNQFSLLEQVLESELPPMAATLEELQVAENVRRLLALEVLFTRSAELDIERGIAYGEHLLVADPQSAGEISGMLSVLYQQRATIRFLADNITGARHDQERSHALYKRTHAPGSETTTGFLDADSLQSYLRALSVKHKYDMLEWRPGRLRDMVNIAVDLQDEQEFGHLTYLTDLVLLQASPDTRALEAAYTVLTDLLEAGGYGTAIDRARMVTLRRRWWVLHCLLEPEVWHDALHADMFYWREIEMFNELRELEAYIERLRPRFDPARYEAIKDTFRRVRRAPTPPDPDNGGQAQAA